MKQIIITFLAILFTTSIFSQVPQAFNYQGVARDLSGNPIPNQNIGLRIAILQGSTTGTEVYKEIQNITTSELGLFNLQIGKGTIVSGDFGAIDWGSDSHFLQIEMDENGGSNYQLIGTSQLLSVPYALYANSTSDRFEFIDSLEYETPHQINSYSGLRLTNHASTNNSTVRLTLASNNEFGFYGTSEIHGIVTGTDRMDIAFVNENGSNSNMTETMRLKYNGNVGIGTTNPDANLEVYRADAGSTIKVTSNTNNEAKIVLQNSVAAYQLVCNDINGHFVISDGTTGEHIIDIDESGNVGIGTQSPTSKLQVVGLPEYADNAAAVSGGLTVGAFYRTGDLLKVVH